MTIYNTTVNCTLMLLSHQTTDIEVALMLGQRERQ